MSGAVKIVLVKLIFVQKFLHQVIRNVYWKRYEVTLSQELLLSIAGLLASENLLLILELFFASHSKQIGLFRLYVRDKSQLQIDL